MRIALDVMGGDYAPEKPLDGAISARQSLSKDDVIVLIGNETSIRQYLQNKQVNPDDFSIVHADQEIGMAEQPTTAITRKKKSSINIGFNLLNQNKIDAFISAGNTGASLVASVYTVNTIPGVIRPSIPALIPKENVGFNVILDVGSNPDCKPDVLYQFALLGSVYAKNVMNIDNPKVGLLNIGEEDEKGNLLTQATFKLMKDSQDFNFVGNVEARQIFKDQADVFVCDGFTGNVVLKEIEAFYELMMNQNLDKKFLNRFNYENYGGTPILGINAIAIIGHGISSAKAYHNMISEAKNIYKAGLTENLKEAFRHLA